MQTHKAVSQVLDISLNMQRTRPSTNPPKKPRETTWRRTAPVKGVQEAINSVPERSFTLKELRKLMPMKHQDFILEYIRNGWNGGKAYRRIYKGTTEASSRVSAHWILNGVYGSQFLAYMRENLEEACNISKARQLNEYAKIAYSSLANLHDSWITRIDFNELLESNPDAIDAIESIDTKIIKKYDMAEGAQDVEYVKIKLYDKVKALERIDTLMQYNKPVQVEISQSAINLERYSEQELATILQLARKQTYSK